MAEKAVTKSQPVAARGRKVEQLSGSQLSAAIGLVLLPAVYARVKYGKFQGLRYWTLTSLSASMSPTIFSCAASQ